MKVLALLFSLFGFVACNQSNSQGEGGQSVSAKEFKALLASTEDYQLVDLRTPGEVNLGIIEGATNINYMTVSFADEINALDKNKPTFIYCRSGGRSAKAMSKMQELGFTNIIELGTGYNGWKALD